MEKFVSNLQVRDSFFKEPDKFEKNLLNQGKDLTLDKAIHIGQTYEMSGSQMKSMEESEEVVHSVEGDQGYRAEVPNPP